MLIEASRLPDTELVCMEPRSRPSPSASKAVGGAGTGASIRRAGRAAGRAQGAGRLRTPRRPAVAARGARRRPIPPPTAANAANASGRRRPRRPRRRSQEPARRAGRSESGLISGELPAVGQLRRRPDGMSRAALVHAGALPPVKQEPALGGRPAGTRRSRPRTKEAPSRGLASPGWDWPRPRQEPPRARHPGPGNPAWPPAAAATRSRERQPPHGMPPRQTPHTVRQGDQPAGRRRTRGYPDETGHGRTPRGLRGRLPGLRGGVTSRPTPRFWRRQWGSPSPGEGLVMGLGQDRCLSWWAVRQEHTRVSGGGRAVDRTRVRRVQGRWRRRAGWGGADKPAAGRGTG